MHLAYALFIKTLETKTIFITGSTGYIGTRLIRQLVARGHRVIALARKGSEHKVPEGAIVLTGDPFDTNSFRHRIPAESIWVQLLGVPHPSPSKAKQFRDIDLRSVKATADAAAYAKASHFIYVSVAMAPSRLMQAYQEVRQEGEKYCLDKKLNCTFIRPWYVLGPGHWWPLLLLPLYGLAEIIPSWRLKTRSMALVTIQQMLRTLINAIEGPSRQLRIVEVSDIRQTVLNNSSLKTIKRELSYK
jgi:uncharacterized protein YbjT (DUF2867 family)